MEFSITPPSPIWQWIGIFVGFLALVVAVMVLPSLIWGKPKVSIDFGVKEVKNGRVLICLLYNLPIANRFLKKVLFVRRMTAQDVVASIKILSPNGQILMDDVPEIITHASTDIVPRINLPPSIIPAEIGVVIYDANNPQVRLFATNRVLPPGSYRVGINVNAEGENIFVERKVVVTNQPPYMAWEE